MEFRNLFSFQAGLQSLDYLIALGTIVPIKTNETIEAHCSSSVKHLPCFFLNLD